MLQRELDTGLAVFGLKDVVALGELNLRESAQVFVVVYDKYEWSVARYLADLSPPLPNRATPGKCS